MFDELDYDEQQILIEIVEDIYFYWTKYETLKDAVILVRNFYKPTPMKYTSPLSEIPRLDTVINYNAFVVAFINTVSFFDPIKRHKDDRLLLDFLNKCKANDKTLYKLSVILYKLADRRIAYSSIEFSKMINDLIEELKEEINKEYIREIKLYRNKILSHHTYIKPEDITEEVSNFLMDAVKFLEVFLLEKTSSIITQVYHSNKSSLEDAVKIFRRKMKPNLLDIVKYEVEFEIPNKEAKNDLLEDELFKEFLNLIGEYESEDVGLNLKITFYNYTSYYDRLENEGINTRDKDEMISRLIDKHELYGTKIKQNIVDQ